MGGGPAGWGQAPAASGGMMSGPQGGAGGGWNQPTPQGWQTNGEISLHVSILGSKLKF